ncbi:MAG TPA: ABC transporter substrate-binding protein [Methylomirabilota bacterium]|nr:ABC transporter substrate-binding protein [Methylomirabilota bacterium]
MRLTVMEPFRSLFYAPQFVALHLGHFADEGFDVTVRTGADATGTTRALIDGTAQFSLGGIMRSLDLADRGGRFLVHFAEVNSRNGFFLLAREARPGFTWPDLAGRTVISFAGAPTPWQCMLTVLRRHGVDPARVTFVRDLHGDDAVRAFREGRGDFLETGQPTAEALIAEGAAHLVVSMGDATGPVPFSSYMTTPERLRREPELCERFTRAVYRAQRWIAANDGRAIAGVVAPSFPDVPGELAARAVERYRRQGTWAADPICRQPGYEYLVDILLAGGFIRRRHRYADLVDTEIARRVVATTRPGP